MQFTRWCSLLLPSEKVFKSQPSKNLCNAGRINGTCSHVALRYRETQEGSSEWRMELVNDCPDSCLGTILSESYQRFTDFFRCLEEKMSFLSEWIRDAEGAGETAYLGDTEDDGKLKTLWRSVISIIDRSEAFVWPHEKLMNTSLTDWLYLLGRSVLLGEETHDNGWERQNSYRKILQFK